MSQFDLDRDGAFASTAEHDRDLLQPIDGDVQTCEFGKGGHWDLQRLILPKS